MKHKNTNELYILIVSRTREISQIIQKTNIQNNDKFTSNTHNNMADNYILFTNKFWRHTFYQRNLVGKYIMQTSSLEWILNRAVFDLLEYNENLFEK